jgi:multidrug efflux pump subunit AcrA (membrane-fusion protein)
MNRTLVLGRWSALGVLLGLAACSHPSAEDASSAPSPYLAIARGSVDVEGGLLHLTAPRDGVVAEVAVRPGDHVEPHTLLVALDSREAELAAGVAEAELAQAKAHAAALRGRLAGVAHRAERAAQAAAAGAASGQSAEDAEAARAELAASIAEADAAVVAAEEKLKQARHEIEVRRVLAPRAGRVVVRNAQPGMSVSAQSGTALVTLLPDGPRIIRAELNEALVDRIHEGASAEVVIRGAAGKSYPAHVVRLGEVFGPIRLDEETPLDRDARDVECILQLDAGNLRVGQRVLVRFLPPGSSSSTTPAARPADSPVAPAQTPAASGTRH